MFQSILCYPCSFLTNYHSIINSKDQKIPIINSMHDHHHSIFTRIRKEQLILIHKKNFSLDPSNFIYNYLNEMISKKKDEEYKPIKTHQEVLNSLVNTEIQLNELD